MKKCKCMEKCDSAGYVTTGTKLIKSRFLGKFRLDVMFFTDTGEVSGTISLDDTTIDDIQTKTKFLYCPFCGRELGKRQNVDLLYKKGDK